MYQKIEKVRRENLTKYVDGYYSVVNSWENEKNDRVYLIECHVGEVDSFLFIKNMRPLEWIPKEILSDIL